MTIPTPSELETFAFNLIKDQDQAKVIVEKVFGLLKKKEAIITDADKRAFLYITVRNKCLIVLNERKKKTMNIKLEPGLGQRFETVFDEAKQISKREN